MIPSAASGFTTASIENIFRGRFYAAADIQLLWKDRESFSTILDAVSRAKKTVCLEFYIYRNDETGMQLSELLKQKVREGVKVHIIYDHFGSFGTPLSFWKDLKASGIRIRASRPFKWIAPFHYVHRDHKKLIVIDSEQAFTGGLNIANEYSGFHLRLKRRGWRDTGIMLKGPVVTELFNIFNKSWCMWGGDPIENSEPPLPSEPGEELPAIPIFVSSSKGRRRIRRLLYYSINHAQKSISLTTAYFTPSRRMVETLEDAVKRGVKVRLLVPGMSDVPCASYAGRAFFSRLLRAGVEIYSYSGEILHAKSSVFDECWSIVGSTNLDFRSLRYNDEGNVGILHAGFATRMAEVFEDDLGHSTKIDYNKWRSRPLGDKLKEHFFSLFRRRL